MDNDSHRGRVLGRNSPDLIALWAQEEPKRAARSPSDEDRRSEQYVCLLAERRLPDTHADRERARNALMALARGDRDHLFSASWDDLAQRLVRGEFKNTHYLRLVKEFVDGTVGKRLGIMERSVAVVLSNPLLAHELDMARFIVNTTPNLEDAERATRVTCELTQRLMPDAKRSIKGYAPTAGATDYFDQGLKYRYVADVGLGAGPTLLREVVIPRKKYEKYLIDASVAKGAFGKVHNATGPNGERLIGRVTRLHEKGEGYTRPITVQELLADNARLAKVDSPLAPRAVVVVDDKVITFQKRYAGNALDLLVNLRKHSDAPANELHPLRHQTVLYFFQYVSANMEHAHDVGVVHRDIKPDNMLYHVSDPPTLGDYDLAYERPVQTSNRAVARQTDIQIAFDGIVGSPGYIAPEIVNGYHGSLYNQKVDVFSLGASLAYMTAYDISDLPYYKVNLPHDTDGQMGMRKAIEIFESWRIRRSVDGNVNGAINWKDVFAGHEPMDRQARCMHKVGERFANTALEMLLPDPSMRPSGAEVAMFAKALGQAAKFDHAGLSKVMTEAQKLVRPIFASQVAIDHHAGVRLGIIAAKAKDHDLSQEYPEDNVWQPRRVAREVERSAPRRRADSDLTDGMSRMRIGSF